MIGPGTLGELPAFAARRFGPKAALIVAGQELSFAELHRRVEAFAAALSAKGIRPGERIIVHLPNGWEWIVAYYAVFRAGAIVVPANALLVAEEVAFLAEDSGAVALVASAERCAAIKAFSGAAGVKLCITVNGTSVPQGVEFGELLQFQGAAPTVMPDPDSVSTIGYTSGTTGKPKGAVLTHRSVFTNTAMTALMHARDSSDIVVTALPCSHVYGNVIMNGAFLRGYTLVLFPRFDAESALEAIESRRATIFEGVPTMYYYLLGAESLGRRSFATLTRCTVGGQTMALPQMHEIQSRLGCPLHELWGMTEIGGLGTTQPAHVEPRLGSIGQALPLSRCRIAAIDDAERTLPPGEVGELLIAGPTVMRGYHNQPAATEEVLTRDGWLRSGDLARRDKEGYFFVVDRKKEMIITAGYNIYPSEVERVIATHSAVQMVAVGAVPDALKGEAAHAFVVTRPNAVVAAGELLEFCKAHLAAYKVPKAIHVVADLPKTSTGKIVRRALHELVSRNVPER